MTLRIIVECYAVSFILTITYAEFREMALYAECNYTQCHYSECRFAECRGALGNRVLQVLTKKGFYSHDLNGNSIFALAVWVLQQQVALILMEVDP